MEIQNSPSDQIDEIRKQYIKDTDAKDNPVADPISELRSQYIKDTDAASLRGQMETRRAEKRKGQSEGWTKFVSNVKKFGDWVGDAYATGVTIVDMARDKDVRRQVVDATKEKAGQIVAEVDAGLSDIFESVEAGLAQRGSEIGQQFNSECNKAAQDIDNVTASIARRGTEIGKKMLNVAGREIVAPFVESVVFPAIVSMDDAHRAVAEVGADVADLLLARPITEGALLLLRVTESPSAGLIKHAAEIGKNMGERKGALHKFAEFFDRKINLLRKTSVSCLTAGMHMRDNANQIRSWYNEANQGRVEDASAVARVSDQLRRGVL